MWTWIFDRNFDCSVPVVENNSPGVPSAGRDESPYGGWWHDCCCRRHGSGRFHGTLDISMAPSRGPVETVLCTEYVAGSWTKLQFHMQPGLFSPLQGWLYPGNRSRSDCLVWLHSASWSVSYSLGGTEPSVNLYTPGWDCRSWPCELVWVKTDVPARFGSPTNGLRLWRFSPPRPGENRSRRASGSISPVAGSWWGVRTTPGGRSVRRITMSVPMV